MFIALTLKKPGCSSGAPFSLAMCSYLPLLPERDESGIGAIKHTLLRSKNRGNDDFSDLDGILDNTRQTVLQSEALTAVRSLRFGISVGCS